jgi:hypothetical protein
VANAQITIISQEKGAKRQTATNEIGEYVMNDLALGHYVVAVEAPGFKRTTHPPVEITVKARVRVDLTLEVGAVTQDVEVKAVAPLIKTDSAEVGGVISREFIKELPVFDRNFLALAALVPGTSPGGRADRRRDLNGEGLTVGGTTSEGNNYVIDGVSDNMDFSGAMSVVPPMDAIQEFAIQTSQYAAEFGRAPGGIVNVAIKSGTNQFHGFGYDYLRNQILDARSYDFTGTHPAKQPLRRNQFGAGAGGPVIRNRAFFFVNYEGTRYPHSALATAIVPTAIEKAGDFSRSGFNIFDPATTQKNPANPSQETRTQFPGNVIPQNRMDPIMARVLSFYPNPNYVDPNPVIRNNYLYTDINKDTQNTYNGRVDQNLRSQDTLMFRYTMQKSASRVQGFLPNEEVGGSGNTTGINTGLAQIHVFGPSLVNETRFGYNRTRVGNEMLAHDNVLSEFNIPGLAVNPVAYGYPQLSIRNFTGTAPVRPIASFPAPFLLVENSFQFLDTVSWHKQNHAVKFGAEIVRHRSDRFQAQGGGASLTFTGNYTTPVVGQNLEAARSALPDALLGDAGTFTTQYVQDATRLRETRFSLFAQDDWRVTRKLTLSPGIRYDLFTPYGELHDRMTNFDYAKGLRTLPESTRPIIESTLGIPHGDLPPTFEYLPTDQVVPHTNARDFSPRFGFAYAVNDRLVVRGGYGIFYGLVVSNYASNQGATTPFFTSLSLTGELDAPVVIRNGFPTGGALAPLSAPTLGFTYFPVDAHDPYSQKYSFNIQVSPFRSTSIETGFTGQRSLHYTWGVRTNVPQPGPGDVQSRRPFPNIGMGTANIPANDSNYNGLEITVRQREFRRLTVIGAFTFSKALGYNTGTGNEGVGTNPSDYRYDYGPLEYDFRRRLVTSWIYRSPSGRHLPTALRQVIGDWQISGLTKFQGGYPFSVNVSGQVLNIGGNFASRANVLRNPNLPVDKRTRSQWFDTSAFTVPPIYTWGIQGKNILRGPGFAQVDFALQKSFRIKEQLRATFRAEAENLLNRVNLGLPAFTLNAPNFGAIRSLDGVPRHIQMVARFEF